MKEREVINMTYNEIKSQEDFIIENWKGQGEKVCVICRSATPFNDSFDNFLKHTVCCGGNWGGMLLTGIRELWPDVYDTIPDKMGHNAFACLCATLRLCGVEF